MENYKDVLESLVAALNAAKNSGLCYFDYDGSPTSIGVGVDEDSWDNIETVLAKAEYFLREGDSQ